MAAPMSLVFEQIYLPCLAQASYLIGDSESGSCAIVDPRRDVDIYLERAGALGLRIAHVIETHLHADFVSGHVELAQRTGATIHVSHRAGAGFPHHALREGDEIALGEGGGAGGVTLRVLETPGHTLESICLLVLEGARPVKVLTGDTLFIGDIGRPDLVASKGKSAEEMAAMHYESLKKLTALPDDVEVWPAHGAGSACGKNISKELSSTIGAQKRMNLMLQPMSKEEFVRIDTACLSAPPAYFPVDAEINRQGAPALAALGRVKELAPLEFQAAAAQAAAGRPAGSILDVRDKATFGAGFVPGAINIGLKGSFATWCGTLLAADAPLLLVGESAAEVDEARMRLARVGLHRVEGALAGGMSAWRRAGLPVATLPQIEPAELRKARGARGQALFVLDVRGPGEHEEKRVPGAVNVPLPELAARMGELDKSRPMAVICASGYRSSAAASLLRRAGFADLRNVAGGTNGWVSAGFETEGATLASR
jgi:glyoxylase-like metal-dependent hydrolase (beta-lactamase superfamily II)/rhodanese-related sulfurtransferase